jgi:hypothetical protein
LLQLGMQHVLQLSYQMLPGLDCEQQLLPLVFESSVLT